MISKSKVIYFLTAIVVVLLILNIFIDPNKSSNEPISLNEVPIAQIESEFLVVLNNSGIQKDWISKKRIRSSKSDSLLYSYEINIPTSVSNSVIIKDLNEKFSNKNIIINSSENKKDASSNLTISSNDIIKLSAVFKYSGDLHRQYSQVAFIVTEFENLDRFEKESFYSLSIPCGILLQLESGIQKLAAEIKQNDYQYFIELNSEADEMDFELHNDLGLDRLSKNIRSIISNFNSPRHFFIDRSKDEFNLSTEQYLINQTKDRGRKIRYSDSLNLLSGEDAKDLLSLVNFHLNTLTFGQSKIFKISVFDWFDIQNLLIQYQKKGNKIVKPSLLL